MSEAANLQDAKDVLRESTVIDALTFIPTLGDVEYFETMRKAGITATHTTVQAHHDTFDDAMRKIGIWYQISAESKKGIVVKSSQDIRKAKKEGKVGIIMGFQEPTPIGDDLNNIELFYRVGIRIVQFAYQRRNYLADGGGERTDCGLSRFGIECVKRMNELGILIDLSHTGYKSTMEAIEYSDKPVAFTHANPRALADTPRNKSDEQIKALASKEGVMGICAFSGAGCRRQGTRPDIGDFLDFIDYVVELVGIDHVGLGFDFNPFWPEEDFKKWALECPELILHYDYPTHHFKGMDDISCLPDVVGGLIGRSYSVQQIEKIMGGNFLSLFEKVWDQ